MYIAFAYFDQSVGGLFSSTFEKAPWSMAKVQDLFKHLWIPAVVLGTSGTASLIRIMRNNLLDELGKPYVVTARAKGMSPWRMIIKYPVRVAINPLVSTVGYLLPALVGGSVIVSVVLSLLTLGPVLLDAINEQDTILGAFILLMLGTLTIIGTFISDIMLAVVDPRIKYTSSVLIRPTGQQDSRGAASRGGVGAVTAVGENLGAGEHRSPGNEILGSQLNNGLADKSNQLRRLS